MTEAAHRFISWDILRHLETFCFDKRCGAWIMGGPKAVARTWKRTLKLQLQGPTSQWIKHTTTRLKKMMNGISEICCTSHPQWKPCIYLQGWHWKICIQANRAHLTCRSTRARCPDKSTWPPWALRFPRYRKKSRSQLRQRLTGNSIRWMKFEASFRSFLYFIHQSDWHFHPVDLNLLRRDHALWYLSERSLLCAVLLSRCVLLQESEWTALDLLDKSI